MKKHLAITAIGYMMFGVALTVQQLGIKAGLGFWVSTTIFVVGFIAWFVTIFTSMEKLKKFIREHDKKNKS